MIKIFNKETNEALGRISEADLQFLADHLEEESVRDTDYYLMRETIEGFAQQGASPKLMEILRSGLRNGNAVEIRWERDQTGTA
ncbi:MAG TPA: galactosyldiacylglycerol synthase [Verrucomicrobiae bacterium]